MRRRRRSVVIIIEAVLVVRTGSDNVGTMGYFSQGPMFGHGGIL